MVKKVIQCRGVTLAVEDVGPDLIVTVAKGVFVFSEALTIAQSWDLSAALREAADDIVLRALAAGAKA